MAPSPVFDIEPKGPDKNNAKFKESVSHKDKRNTSKTESGSSSKDKASVDSLSFNEIEEAGLKSLLDEAYSYKSPKDRVGKSVLFQELLNEVEENDVSKKNLADRSKEFIDGLKAAAAIENGHDSVSDKNFLNNILGNCEKDKKKKKGKRDGSSTNNGSRKPKFSHSLKINHGPQSSSTYNGNNNNNSVHYHSSSRSLSRAQQSLSARLNNSKAAALLTSSSNIDIPMVTTYNKQPIMTPALLPSTQQKTAEFLMLDLRDQKANCGVGPDEMTANTTAKNTDIEMKILDKEKHNDSVYNYTTHASLEIGGAINEANNVKGRIEDDEKLCSINDTSSVSFPLQSLTTLMNGNAETSIQSLITYKPLNGLSDENENVANDDENDDKESGGKKSKKKAVYLDDIVDSCNKTSIPRASVDDANTVNPLQQKNVQNSTTASSALKYHPEPSYTIPWSVPGLIVTLAGDSSGAYGRTICTKESPDSKKLGDENANTYSFISNTPTSSNGKAENGSDKKKRKPKKSDKSIRMSEEIPGYCGDQSLSYVLQYIEDESIAIHTGDVKMSKNGEKQKPRARTDDDIRSKKLPKAKERLKKSTSLEDLRHDYKTKPNKKQSSVDDSHYTLAKEEQDDEIVVNGANEFQHSVAKSDAKYAASSQLPVDVIEMKRNDKFQLPVDESLIYFDSLIDDDNYTENEFHLVTKKQRKKKRRSKSRTSDQKTYGVVDASSLSQNFLPHNYTDKNDGGGFKRSPRGNAENRHRSRRKSVSSVVPSDKISDTDSIHSLPVSSTTPKCKIKKKSTSSGCTPQASYADIAKSPQCQSSNVLNGNAKWHMKQFSNSPSSSASSSSSSSSSSNTHSTTVSSLSSTSSSNTGDTPDHSDTPELVSSTKHENRVGLDDSCDQLLLTDSSNNISNNSSGPNSPLVNNADEVKNSNNNINNNNVNYNEVTRIDVTLKRKGKKSKNTENDNNNNSSHVCCNGKLEKSTKDESTNSNINKVKKVKNKKKCIADENDSVIGNVNNDNNNSSNCNCDNNSSSKHEEKNNDLFIEFTLKRSPAVTTKCSETQTDSVEVNNNSCCNDVSVEQTIILKCNRNGADDGAAKVNKLSHSLPVDETGNKVVVLEATAGSEVTIGFNVNEQILNYEDTATTKQKQLELVKEHNERSSKYNVSEVIQYVNKSWNEVMKTLSSAKVTAANNKVQYYSAQ